MTRTTLALVAVALAGACTDLSFPSASGPRAPRAQNVAGGGRPQTLDEEFAAIASAESSFGGFFLDSTHSPVVYLTNTSRLGAVRVAGLDASLSKRRIPAGNLRVVPAAYGFGALKRWYDCAAPQVLALPNTILTDIDEAQNRLHFGVAMPSAEGDVQTVVTRCEIPRQAVTVDVVRPVRRLGGLNESVQDSVRPLRGGIIMAYYPAPNGCTLGVIGRSGEGLFFITAAHCSHTQGSVPSDTTSYWQRTVNNSPDSIGRETLDPAFFTYPELGCPSGHLCRMSDANMSRLHSTATAQVGLIARTLSPSHNPAYPGSTALDLFHPGLFITAVDTSPGPVVGDSVCKTGLTSGTTCGAITCSCGNITIADTTMICQMTVHMYSGYGDSGSPIYHWTSSTDSTVRLAGILWGGEDVYHTWYSQWDWVWWELFRADTVTVVADTPYTVPVGGEVLGPSSIGVADTYEWDAHTYGGTGSNSYQWAYQNAGSSSWISLGTYQYQQRYVDGSTPDFTMRVTITSGSYTASPDLLVDVNPITSVGLTGPSWVPPSATCSYTSSPEGGNPPYIYEWTGVLPNAVDTTSGPDTFYASTGQYYFTIYVTVTAANGSQESASLQVNVEEGAPDC